MAEPLRGAPLLLCLPAERRERHGRNQEIVDEFQNAVEGEAWQEVKDALSDSENLLKATIRGDSEAVAEGLRRVHAMNSSVLKYNDENSLSCAVTIAYFTARRDYTIIRELPMCFWIAPP